MSDTKEGFSQHLIFLLNGSSLVAGQNIKTMCGMQFGELIRYLSGDLLFYQVTEGMDAIGDLMIGTIVLEWQGG